MTVHEAEKIRMPFGHYKGDLLLAIAMEDPLYLDWLSRHQHGIEYLVEPVAVLVAKHAETIAQKRAAGEKPKLFAETKETHARRPVQLKLL